jgi:hypothetical protein
LGWGSKHDRVRRDIFGEAGHGSDHHLIADFDVSAKSHFASQGNVIAQSCASGDPDLGAEYTVLANSHIVSNLAKVIDFGSLLDPCAAKAGTINRCVGANFHIIIDLDNSGLWDFLVTPFSEFIAKSFGAHDDAVVEYHAIPDFGAFTDGDMTPEKAIIAKYGFLTDKRMGFDSASIANFNSFFNNNISANVRIFSDFSFWADLGGGMDSGWILHGSWGE